MRVTSSIAHYNRNNDALLFTTSSKTMPKLGRPEIFGLYAMTLRPTMLQWERTKHEQVPRRLSAAYSERLSSATAVRRAKANKSSKQAVAQLTLPLRYHDQLCASAPRCTSRARAKVQ